ncbi:hypothetical protein BOX15_Mlig016534g1 [Macrostomum lignano]|uniref:IQCH-like ATP-grasp domain-containing protein n=1 Tax=Macrostomum lignano TaxID=282301 RepID=A0A267G1X3_9PLAT|nr:hypothetical protein BOX15_Mlig016534g1 [Macrostomum lignano]
MAADVADCVNTRYAVLNGRTRTEASDFEAFRRRYGRGSEWGRVAWAARCMEQFLTAYSVPIAFVNGEKLAALAEQLDLSGRRPTGAQLLDCLINRSDVARLVSQPGRRFSGPDGRFRACALIQARWRGFAQRRRYLELRRRRQAAVVIATAWLLQLRRRVARVRLSEARSQHLDGYRRRLRLLAKNWADWQRQRRVLVHIPSAGLSERTRSRLGDDGIDQLQAGQMARLCDIRDPNVDVVLVCPRPVSPEVAQYFSRLAGLQPAIRSGRAEDQADASRRFRLVVPEAVGQFRGLPLCLSTLLNYSPKALRQIREVVVGRRAFIVPGLACADDLAVADQLDLPILCPEPGALRLYSGSAGVGEILRAAGLPMPPGEAGLAASVECLADRLAALVTSNLDVGRWQVTLEDSVDEAEDADRSRRVFDTERLRCRQWALEERQRLGEAWSTSWSQEGVKLKVLEELHQSDSAGLSGQCGREFLAEFAARGGCIRACADGRAARVSADLCVEPSGAVRLVSCADGGGSGGPRFVPQSALPPSRLSELCGRLGSACFERRLIGHVSVEFDVFQEGGSSAPAVLTAGLRFGYSDTAAMAQLLQFATNSSLDPVGHELTMRRRLPGGGGGGSSSGVRHRPRTAAAAVGSTGSGRQRRFAALSAGLRHSGLAAVDFGVFFQLCKARGVGFDVADLTGTVFCLAESARRDRLCVLTVSNGSHRARAEFARVLAAINEELGAAELSNFADYLPPEGERVERLKARGSEA